MPAKLNFFKTPASERLVSSRSVSISTGISGCFQPGQAKVGPGPTSLMRIKELWGAEDVAVLNIVHKKKKKKKNRFTI